MLQLDFSGWFQCRLATDPDPSDEPRGISGSTFALPGEPDLDRIIRTQPAGATQRVPGPQIGVSVKSVAVDGKVIAQHPLKDAPVMLLSDPVFEGRNGFASEDADEPIFPFHIRIEANGIRLEREFREFETGAWRFQTSNGVERNDDLMKKAGITVPPPTYIANRRAALVEQLAQATDPLQKLALQARLRHFDTDRFGPVALFVGLRYRYRLEGPWFKVGDPNGRLGGMIDGSPWLLSAWTGCWDGDALCGFMDGSLLLPFQASA